MIKLINDIKAYEKILNNIQTDIGDKYQSNTLNHNFAKLSLKSQDKITNVIKMISKVIEILGNIIKYVMTDINTIEKEINILLQKGNLA